MPSLRKLFDGHFAHVLLETSGIYQKAPPPGYAWLVIGGVVHNITGTDTVVQVVDKNAGGGLGGYYNLLHWDLAATVTGTIPLFNLRANESNPAWTLPFVFGDEFIRLAGDAGAWANIEVLEFEYQ